MLYYQQIGLAGWQTGILLGLAPLASLLSGPFWTGLADTRHQHKTILNLTLILTVSTVLVLPLTKTFNLLILIVTGFSFFVTPIMALVDSATISMLGARRERYGRIRLWGTIGWGLASLVAGVFLQRFGLVWMFWIYCGLMLLNLLPISKLIFIKSITVTPFWSGLRGVMNNRRWVWFLFIVFIAGIGLSAHANYLAILIQSKGGDKSMIGIALFLSTVSEMPVMFFSNIILKKLKPRGLLVMAVTFASLRCMLYSLVAGAQVVLLIQLLHGFTFPSLWVAGVNYVAENAPPGLNATLQAIFGSVLNGFGLAAGGVLGGILIDQVGLPAMYLVLGLVVLAGLVLFLIFDRQPVQVA